MAPYTSNKAKDNVQAVESQSKAKYRGQKPLTIQPHISINLAKVKTKPHFSSLVPSASALH
jgi:hypothetical protein